MANWFYHSFHKSGKGDTTFPNFSEDYCQQQGTNSCVEAPQVLLPYMIKKKNKNKNLYSSLHGMLNTSD